MLRSANLELAQISRNGSCNVLRGYLQSSSVGVQRRHLRYSKFLLNSLNIYYDVQTWPNTSYLTSLKRRERCLTSWSVAPQELRVFGSTLWVNLFSLFLVKPERFQAVKLTQVFTTERDVHAVRLERPKLRSETYVDKLLEPIPRTSQGGCFVEIKVFGLQAKNSPLYIVVRFFKISPHSQYIS